MKRVSWRLANPVACMEEFGNCQAARVDWCGGIFRDKITAACTYTLPLCGYAEDLSTLICGLVDRSKIYKNKLE
jgi:hypothetical protein